MTYRVKIDSFEGPFELLLALVSQHKVKIGSISVSEVADQYMEYIDQMQDLDMDVASEFLVVASTLLSLKARALLPAEKTAGDEDEDDEFDNMTAEQVTDLLATRIITYYQYKRVTSWLGSRMQNEATMHPRTAGPDQEFLGLLPDYLEGVSLEGLGTVCASLMAKRESFLLDAEHIAAKPISVETYIANVEQQLSNRRRMTFSEIIADAEDNAHIVVSFLAILEMYKRGMITLEQEEPGKPINVDYIDPSEWEKYAMDSEEGQEPIAEEDVQIDNNAASSESHDGGTR